MQNIAQREILQKSIIKSFHPEMEQDDNINFASIDNIFSWHVKNTDIITGV